ncbi:hypothetical protein [Rhizobium leguminosarum]|nr:hypothetical protein [Rhizobium leguminosarum]MBP2446889.1 hypothetical protein [Rhizobium leguminosarum]
MSALASRMADLVDADDEQNRPMPPMTGATAEELGTEARDSD